jgi:choline dehydrogenase
MALLSSLTIASLAASAAALVDVPKNHGVPGVDATYDYVVIGGGTSGLTIAARLAEDPDVSVAVIEAGGYYEIEGGPPSIIPGLAGIANTGTDPSDKSPIDWNFVAEPLSVCLILLYSGFG